MLSEQKLGVGVSYLKVIYHDNGKAFEVIFAIDLSYRVAQIWKHEWLALHPDWLLDKQIFNVVCVDK